MEETERDFFSRLASDEEIPELQRYFQVLAEIAVFSDRERHVAQAEEYRKFLVEKREAIVYPSDTRATKYPDRSKWTKPRHGPGRFNSKKVPARDLSHLVVPKTFSASKDFSSRDRAGEGLGTHTSRQPHELQADLDKAETLGELGTIALRHLMEQAGIDDKYLMPLKKRLRWVDGVDWTLETAASLIDVTRERLRQVVRRLDGYSVEVLVSPKVLFRALQVGASANDLEEFFASLRSEGLAHTDDQWSKQALTELFLVVGNEDVQDQLASIFRKLTPAPRSIRLEGLIREHRQKEFGIILISNLSKEIKTPIEDLLVILSQMYKHVFADEELAVTVGNPPGGFISAVGKQLLVNPCASPDQLLVGLRKVEAYRHAKVLVGKNDFRRALNVTFGDPPRLANIPDVLSAGVKLTPFEVAVSEKFDISGRNLLHRDELVEAAVENGVAAVSAGVYLSTSPIIRSSPVRRGYFSLV